MELKPVRTSCPDKVTCPTIYKTDRGTYFVQGRRIADPDGLSALAELGIPDDEVVHEIPASMLPELD